jgi:SAM-dependent methyltransferase
MEGTLAYRLWQAPFANKKFEPVLRNNDLFAVRHVLDVGCGPGTNTRHFAAADYLGLDFNEKYIEYARRRYGREFISGDIREYVFPPGAHFDFILANSLLHHIDLENTHRILSRLHTQLTEDGHIHILDLVLPETACLAGILARLDRGEFPRPITEWLSLFTAVFEAVVIEPYSLRALGVNLWNMIYFKGRRRA